MHLCYSFHNSYISCVSKLDSMSDESSFCDLELDFSNLAPHKPLILSPSKDEPAALMVRQAHHERLSVLSLAKGHHERLSLNLDSNVKE